MDPRFYSEGDESAGQLPSPSVIFAKAEIQKYNQSSMDPRFAARVTNVSGQRVAKVQGKHPSQSVILCESRESRNIISQAWPPAFTARVTMVWVSTPVRHFREGGNPEILSAKNGPPCSRSVMSITGWYICDMRILF